MIQKKECSGCGVERTLDEFGRCKTSRDGLNYICKICSKERAVAYRRSVEGLISKTYSHQKQSSKRRGHEAPTYTKRELLEYAKCSEEFMRLFEEWCSCGYVSYSRPSFDRLDDSKGYSFDNIQVTTWKENERKQIDKRATEMTKAVCRYSTSGELMEVYQSVSEASVAMGKSRRSSTISNCCNGRYETAFGFIWRHKE